MEKRVRERERERERDGEEYRKRNNFEKYHHSMFPKE